MLKKIINLYVTMVVVLALAACVATGGVRLTTHQRFEIACTGTGTALGVLAQLNNHHKLTKAEVSTISDYKARIHPYCSPASGDYPYTADELTIQAVETAANYIKIRSTQP